MSLSIKNCKIVNGNELVSTNIYIKEGKIEQIGDLVEAEQIIDAKGKVVIPGAIDGHVHFREPGLTHKEDFYTGSCAAAAGGVTTIIDMPNTNPPTLTVDLLEEKRKLAAAKSIVNFGFHFGSSLDNLEEIKKVTNIASVKIFMGSSTGNMLIEDESYISEIFKSVPVVSVHAEHEASIRTNTEEYKDKNEAWIHAEIRDNAVEARAVEKVLSLQKGLHTRVGILHCGTKEALSLVSDAKKNGQDIFLETTPHHLFLTKDELRAKGNYAKMNPPLRTPDDVQALWKGISEEIVDTVGTDHAPHLREEKDQSFWKAPCGVPGVETMLPLLLDAVNKNRITLQDVIRITSESQARIYGMKGKGKIEVGYDADLVLVDMDKVKLVKNEELFTKCKWSPYHGWELQGWPVLTLVNGTIVFQEGKVIDSIKGKEATFEPTL